jgi:hypothetical protein
MHIKDIHISVILRGFRGGQAFFDPFGVKINVNTGATVGPNFFVFFFFILLFIYLLILLYCTIFFVFLFSLLIFKLFVVLQTCILNTHWVKVYK